MKAVERGGKSGVARRTVWIRGLSGRGIGPDAITQAIEPSTEGALDGAERGVQLDRDLPEGEPLEVGPLDDRPLELGEFLDPFPEALEGLGPRQDRVRGGLGARRGGALVEVVGVRAGALAPKPLQFLVLGDPFRSPALSLRPTKLAS